MNSPVWNESTKNRVEVDLNKNPEKIKVIISDLQIKINRYEFDKIKKVGLTIPLFKKEATIVFEGRFDDSYAHIHITTKSHDFLEIFNKLMSWKNRCFPGSRRRSHRGWPSGANTSEEFRGIRKRLPALPPARRVRILPNPG